MIFRQHDLEPASLQIAADRPARAHGKAEAAELRLVQNVARIGAHLRRDAHRLDAVRPGQPPDLLIVQRQAGVLGQIGRRLRAAMAVQILRRGANHPPAGRKLPRNQARIVQLGNPDRQVHALADDIDDLVRQVHLDGEIGMLHHEAGEIGCDMHPGKHGRRRDAQRAAGLGVHVRHERFGIVDIPEDFDDALIKPFAGFGELELTRRALKQAHAKPLFHMANSFADNCR